MNGSGALSSESAGGIKETPTSKAPSKQRSLKIAVSSRKKKLKLKGINKEKDDERETSWFDR